MYAEHIGWTYHFVSTKFHPYPGNGRREQKVKIPSVRHVLAENRIVRNGMRQLFFVTDPLGFPIQLSVSLYLLPVLRGRFDSNIHVT